MRMTNKIMRNNSLYNINLNKTLEDKLTNQMTNQSKIVRPSDDPVIAIRALRLRSNVTNVTQYYDKNAPDADQWLNVTGKAMETVNTILTDLYKQAEDASNKYLGSEDLSIILEQMASLTDEFYSSGNVDYAGRYVFSGYRTDTTITFTAEQIKEMGEHPVKYDIEENLGYEDISTVSYTNYEDLTDEQKISNHTLYRFRLAYDNTDGTAADGVTPTLALKDKNGVNKAGNNPTMQTFDNAEEAYKAVAEGTLANGAVAAYIPSTGEIVFSEEYYKANYEDGDQITVNYSKSDWQEGDINPVHYFKCVETTDYNDPAKAKSVNYNFTQEDQSIYYDVGFNQQIQVNTTADEIFHHAVRRDIEDFNHFMTQLKDVEKKIADIEEEMSLTEEGTAAYTALEKKLEAANKAYTYVRDNIQTKFENQITKYQQYMDDSNIAITNNATRGSRLDLISDRLMNQKTTFKELQSNNEDIDVTEVAVELSSADLTYQAALMATSKIMQTNLMNYI
jgi:flagellar hook-associated protein 3 FlgL